MPLLTFQGGAVEVVVYKNGTEINLSNFPEFFRAISSVRAKVKGGETSSITINLTPDFNDALKIMRSGLLGSSASKDGQLPNSNLSSVSSDSESIQSSDTKPTTGTSNFTYYACRFFYIGGESTPWYGGFTCVPSFTLGATIDFSITVTGVHNLMAIGGGPNHFDNQPALDVLETLADAYGIDITFDEDDTQTEALLSNTNISGSYNEDYDGVIRRILSDLRCVYVKYDGDDDNPQPQYRVKSTSYLSQQPTEFRFCYWRQVFPELGDVPVEELRLESSGALFAPGGVFGTFSRAVLSRTKETMTKASAPGDFTYQPNSGTKSAGGAFPKDNGDGSAKGGATGLVGNQQIAGMDVPALHRDESSTLDRAQARAEIDSMGFLVFHAKTPGLPGLRPLSSIQLLVGDATDGLEAFSGTCHVRELEHFWQGDGWTTESFIARTAGPVFDPSASEKESEPPTVSSDSALITPKGIA